MDYRESTYPEQVLHALSKAAPPISLSDQVLVQNSTFSAAVTFILMPYSDWWRKDVGENDSPSAPILNNLKRNLLR